MKTLLIGASAIAAIAAPGLASAETRGSIDLNYQYNDFSYCPDCTFQSYSLGGTIIHELSDNLTVQADGRTMLQHWDGNSGDDSHGYAAAHLSGAVGTWDVGGFVGLLNYYGDGGTLFGAETRTSYGEFSFDGSISYSNFSQSTDYSGVAYRAGGSYFFDPNFSVTAGASWTSIDSSTDYDITELSLGAAYQFSNNVEIYGGYTNTNGDRSGGSSYDGDTIQLGVRLNIGGGTLQENTNHGAWTSAEHVSDTWSRW